jgi:hypothetical protein
MEHAIKKYIRTFIHTYIHTCIHTYVPTYLHTYVHTYLHTYVSTYIHVAKMAEDGVTRDIEAALNKIVNTTEQSGNMRKELKKTTYETVSTLRNLL